MNALQQTSLAQAMMSSPQALASQLENMAQRQPWLAAPGLQARRLADACVQRAKLRRLLSLCDELKAARPRDWRVVVFTHRKETQEAIGRALARQGVAAALRVPAERNYDRRHKSDELAKPLATGVRT